MSFEPKKSVKEENLAPQAVITVRMSSELHQQLKSAAHKAETSLNKLCIDMLEHCLDSMMAVEAKSLEESNARE